MRLQRSSREWFVQDIVTDPAVTTWEASFDEGETWVAATAVDTYDAWLVAGPDFDPIGQEIAPYQTIANTCQPLLRAIDVPEVVTLRGTQITLTR